MDKQVLAVLAGERGSATAFYRSYEGVVRRFLRAKVKEETVVEELLQDTFLSAFDGLPLYRGESTLKTWLIGIARHEVLDYYRKRYVRKVVEQTGILWEGIGESGTTPEIELRKSELTEQFDQAMMKLSQKYRRVLEMRYLKGSSVKEIAAEVKMSFKATESLLYRARAAFAEAYEE